MKELPSTIRGLINDLTRTLTSSLVHMDDLFLHLDKDSEEFDDAWLANCQLERALEFLLELRSEYNIRQMSINQRKTKSLIVATGPQICPKPEYPPPSPGQPGPPSQSTPFRSWLLPPIQGPPAIEPILAVISLSLSLWTPGPYLPLWPTQLIHPHINKLVALPH